MFAMSRARLQIAVIVGAAFAALFAALLALAAFSSPASAGHSWSNFHWGRTANPFTVQLDDNLTTADWKTYLATASYSETKNDWNESTELDTTIAQSTNTKQCQATSGRVEVCNAKYGRTGWIGLASIWTSSGHIVQGTAKMNDTYFTTTKYNKPKWKYMVMCQEVGHTFGLGHVNETYDTPNTGSCMDYTSDPDGLLANPDQLSNEYPNAHDHEQLSVIYGGHSGETNTVSSTSAASKLPPAALAIDTADPSQRGQLVYRSPDGAIEIYERDFGQGNKVITRLIRAVEGTPTLDERPTGQGGGAPHTHDDSHEH